jgi:hypothetical protein
MTLAKLFKTVSTRLEQWDADVKACAVLLTAQGEQLGYTNAELFRLWRKYSNATGKRYF